MDCNCQPTTTKDFKGIKDLNKSEEFLLRLCLVKYREILLILKTQHQAEQDLKEALEWSASDLERVQFVLRTLNEQVAP